MDDENKMLRDAQKWQVELERAILAHGGDDIVVPYDQVARAFPSTQPNSHSFHEPLLNHDQLKQWAAAAKWQVRPAPEMAPPGNDDQPPVRFTKIK